MSLGRGAGLLACLILAAMTTAKAADFEEGQIWRYDTRPHEQGSRLFIARVDRGLWEDPIFHIYVDGLRLKNPYRANGYQDHLPHLPVSRETLEASVTALEEAKAAVPDVSRGYATWRKEFDRGGAGVFTIPVRQIIQYIEEIANQQN